MNKAITNIVIGVIIGVVLASIIGWKMMPGMMLNEHSSPYGVKETVEKITQNVEAAGWKVLGVTAIHEAIKDGTGVERNPVYVIKLCQPDYARRILQQDHSLAISSMMPCIISVYEKEDGTTYISTRNVGLLGKMFGGDIAEVMGEVQYYEKKFIEFAK